MSARGSEVWSYKWYGDPDASGYRERNIVDINFCGRTMHVHRKAKRHFLWLERVFKQEAPRYADAIDSGQLDDWSYNNRYINGTNVKSNHSFGIAIDLNALSNARGTQGNMPDAVIRRATRNGFGWGGSWSNPDSMHFESHLVPTEIRARFTRDGHKRWTQR